ncbi:uncharacterized protein TNCV_335331 [Trichonephila clavipes]|nr:uncharacterized protein TNCV_335331 [Trichonephila clavipes]
MRLRTLWPRLALAKYQSRQQPSPFLRFSLELNTRIRPLGLPPEHHWYQCSRPGGSLAHGFTRQDQTLLARFRSGHIKSMKFSEGRKSFEMCTNCSSEPATSAHILECLGSPSSRRSLAGVGLSESVRCHGPGLALLTKGGVQQQQQKFSGKYSQSSNKIDRFCCRCRIAIFYFLFEIVTVSNNKQQ